MFTSPYLTLVFSNSYCEILLLVFWQKIIYIPTGVFKIKFYLKSLAYLILKSNFAK